MDLNDLTVAVNQQTNEQVKRAIDYSFNALVVNVPNAKLPEHVFKQLFLPLLAGEIKETEISNLMIYWISVAGSPTGDIDIIDTRGDVLFTLPSVLNTTMIDPSNHASGLSDLYTEAQMYFNQLPVMGERFLIPGLGKKLGEILNNLDNPKVVLIRSILERYGKTPPLVTAMVNNQDDDELIY